MRVLATRVMRVVMAIGVRMVVMTVVVVLVLGRVVPGVLLEVALFAGALDLLGHLDAPAGGEIVELGPELVVGRA